MAVRINRLTDFSLGLLLFLVQVIESNVLHIFFVAGAGSVGLELIDWRWFT